MSVEMDRAADAILQAAGEQASLDEELSDVELDEERSSSLSDIEDKDPEQDEDAEGSDDLSNVSDEENDSEAETERLEESPNKFRPQQDVVLSSHSNNQIYDRSPSKLHNQIIPNHQDDEEDDDPLSEDDMSVDGSPDSPKSSPHDPEPEPPTAPTSLEDSSGDNKKLLSVIDADTRKRKRSIMAGSGFDEDLGEPLRKRTGSVMTPADQYAIEDDINNEEELDTSNPISGNISGEEGGAAQEDDAPEEIEEPVADDDNAAETPEVPISPKKRGRKKKKTNGIEIHEDETAADGGEILVNGEDEVRIEEDNADNEGDDEAEAALKNEEELEKKRIALDQLSAIERQFTTFRERLYDERLEALNREEAMLRQANPTHPEYLAMLECLNARKDERIRVATKIREYEMQTLKKSAVARRSQILTQFQQEVREIREKKLEQLGKQWYEIQHDRRSYAGSVPDYTLKFPTRRSQQIQNQIAYSSEVSILSGVAKYVGFPAAPPMASATVSELEEDFEKMGRTRPAQPAGLPLGLAALRSAGSTSNLKPAEEQFIEQTPWANPQHPSHAHLLQRQASAQQAPRVTSPFSQVHVQPRRHSHQQGAGGGPISGTFSNTSTLLPHSNGVTMTGGRISPHNPLFANSTHSHTMAPSPLGSRQTSISPQQNRVPPSVPNSLPSAPDIPKSNGIRHSSPIVSEIPRDFPHEVRREPAAMMSRF